MVGALVYLLFVQDMKHGGGLSLETVHDTFDGAEAALKKWREHWENSPLNVQSYKDGSFRVIDNSPYHHVIKYYFLSSRFVSE